MTFERNFLDFFKIFEIRRHLNYCYLYTSCENCLKILQALMSLRILRNNVWHFHTKFVLWKTATMYDLMSNIANKHQICRENYLYLSNFKCGVVKVAYQCVVPRLCGYAYPLSRSPFTLHPAPHRHATTWIAVSFIKGRKS